MTEFAWDIFSETQDVKDWYNLGLQLGFVQHELDIIKQASYGNLDKAKMDLYTKWEDDGSASWGRMIEALRAIGYGNKAEELSKKYEYGKL